MKPAVARFDANAPPPIPHPALQHPPTHPGRARERAPLAVISTNISVFPGCAQRSERRRRTEERASEREISREKRREGGAGGEAGW